MYPTKISNFFLASALIAGSFSVANAQTLTILETHDVQCVVADTTLTNWDETCQIPLYNPADHSGSVLDEVMLTLVGTASSMVNVTAVTETTLNPSEDISPNFTGDPAGFIGATVTANWTLGGTPLKLQAFPASPIAGSQNLTFQPSVTPTTLADLMGTDNAMATIPGTGDFGSDTAFTLTPRQVATVHLQLACLRAASQPPHTVTAETFHYRK